MPIKVNTFSQNVFMVPKILNISTRYLPEKERKRKLIIIEIQGDKGKKIIFFLLINKSIISLHI